MDEAVKDETMKRLFGAGLLLAAAWLPATAQVLRDPTRPPPSMMEGGAREGAAAAAPAAGPQLQSVLISRQPGGRHVAVIDGETVRLGDSFRGARVTRMSANEVELVRGRERRVLKLNAPSSRPPAGAGIERVRRD